LAIGLSGGAVQQVPRGVVDARCAECGSRREQLSRCSRAWYDAKGQVRQPKWRHVFPDEGFEHA
jgi:hypothetical protein